MPVKTITHPETGQVFRFGRNAPTIEAIMRPRLFIESYYGVLPTVPKGPLGNVDKVKVVVEQMYDNDKYGDCTIAGKAHLIGTFTGLANPPAAIFPNKVIDDDYFRLTGGQDNGLDELTVLEDWRDNPRTGLGSAHQIGGFATLDPSNASKIKLSLYLFSNLYLGLNLPDQWISPPPSKSGFVWDVAGDENPNNGHCVVGIDYNEQGVIILTWGMWGIMTYPALAKYLANSADGETHLVLTSEIVEKASQKAPNGINWAQLTADYQALQS